MNGFVPQFQETYHEVASLNISKVIHSNIFVLGESLRLFS